jgi:hypothetical protein
VRDPHAKESAWDYLRPPPPPGPPTRDTRRLLRRTPRNPSRHRIRVSRRLAASPSRSTPRDAQGGEEFYRAACGRPRALHRPQLLAGAPPLPEPHRRTVCRLRRVPAASAALDGIAVPCVASRCFPRIESSPGTLDRVSPASPPPLAAPRRRRPPPHRMLASHAAGFRSDASDRIPPSLKPASNRSLQI